MSGSAARPLRVAVMVHSKVASDPRVRRQIETFRDAGYDLCVLGHRPFPESDDRTRRPAPSYCELPTPRASQSARLWRVLEKVPARFRAAWAAPITLRWPTNRVAVTALREFRPDVIHANDWPTLPVGAKLKGETGCKLVYDSHEYAIEELSDNRIWRLTYKPHVRAIEQTHIKQADSVITVSDGIAQALHNEYHLERVPKVVRNAPQFEASGYRAPGDALAVLYHGLVAPGRGLEALVDSVVQWRPDRELTIRGPGSDEFLKGLRARAERIGVSSRVVFEPGVAPSKLISCANRADIGVHPIPPISVQTDYCLPNKLFEYAMAGLCLCVSPAAEMARVVTDYDMGVVAASANAAGIASAINSLDAQRVAYCKRRALEAAKELCWEQESKRLLDVYQDWDVAHSGLARCAGTE